MNCNTTHYRANSSSVPGDPTAPLVARLVALALVLQGMALALPWSLAFVVDRVIPRGDRGVLGLLAVGVPALIGGYAIVAWLRGRASSWLVRDTSRELLDRVFRHLLTLPLPYFHGRPVEDLVIRMQGADLVLDELLDQVMAAVLDTLVALVALVALLALYPSMSGLVLGAALLQGVLTWLAQRASLDDWVRDILSASRLYQFAASTLTGIADLKMIGVGRIEPSWRAALGERLEARQRRRRRSALWEGLLAGTPIGAQLLVLVGGALLAIQGRVTLGAAVGFYSLAGVCLGTVSTLAGTAYRFRSTAEYLRRACEILTARPERESGTRPAEGIHGALSFRNVSFRYAPTSDPVLRDVSLDIAPGEMVVLVGATGSGKSTLARIAATLYDPTAGEARIDDIPVSDYARSDLRARIGCVFQEHVLVEGTILDNVTLGREIPIEQVYDALELACLLEDVNKMPLLLATPVGAGGLHLSGGQRQRLCLARAVASRPAILVLDEATSSVDRLTERRLYANLERLRCMRLLATHRLYVAAQADRVLVLDEGRIVQSGSHRELLAREGRYRAMWGKGPQESAARSERMVPDLEEDV